jgi:hypothetical protein
VYISEMITLLKELGEELGDVRVHFGLPNPHPSCPVDELGCFVLPLGGAEFDPVVCTFVTEDGEQEHKAAVLRLRWPESEERWRKEREEREERRQKG